MYYITICSPVSHKNIWVETQSKPTRCSTSNRYHARHIRNVDKLGTSTTHLNYTQVLSGLNSDQESAKLRWTFLVFLNLFGSLLAISYPVFSPFEHPTFSYTFLKHTHHLCWNRQTGWHSNTEASYMIPADLLCLMKWKWGQSAEVSILSSALQTWTRTNTSRSPTKQQCPDEWTNSSRYPLCISLY